MIALRILGFLGKELMGSKMARGALLALVVLGAAAFGLWRVHHAGYVAGVATGARQMAQLRASYAKRLSDANVAADQKILAWQRASNKLAQQVITEKATADAAQAQIAAKLAQDPGAGAPLSPYLGRAAGLLYAPAGTPH